MKSPCANCTRVANPYCCSDKNCVEWRTWWLDAWNKMRANVLAKIKNTKK